MKKVLIVFTILFQFAFAQEKHINNSHVDWETIETKHFYVHYYSGTERSAKVISKIAEEIYEPITSLYKYEPDTKISFVIKDFDDYSNGAAYFFDNKIEIFAPALDFDLRGTHNWLRNVVTHEFTHIIQLQSSMKFSRKFPAVYLQWLNYEEERRQDVLYGYPNVIASYPISGINVPSWFAEGVAQNNRPEFEYDNWDSHRDMILRIYALNNKLLTWNEMSVFGKNSLGNESSYNAGFSLSRYIHNKYGEEAIPKIARVLSNYSSFTMSDAIQNVLGKSGEELYSEWKKYITEDYKIKSELVKNNLNEGKIISNEGFGNFYPTYSPSGKKLAFCSTKERDYFSQSSLYVKDLKGIEDEEIMKNVSSSLTWSKDENLLYYSKITSDNKYFSEQSDIYFWNFADEEETRLTFGLRAMNPTLSPDEKWIAFVFSRDGTSNLGIVSIDGKNYKQVTKFQNGELCSVPKYSPDGKKIIFGFSERNTQDIGEYSFSDSSFKIILIGNEDQRHPNYSISGNEIYFSSDKTGIYNLYKYNLESQQQSQITNVLGGAFYPSINTNGKIVFSLYTQNGFIISEVESEVKLDYSKYTYLKEEIIVKNNISNSTEWNNLKMFNDTNIEMPDSKSYQNIFTSMSIIPFLRFDNYNKGNSGIQNMKPGFYFTSTDVIDKYSLFGGVAMNSLFERDVFLIFDYRDALPIFYQLGLSPTLTLQLFNVTRKNNSELELVRGFNKYPLKITYGLSEFSFSLKHHIYSEADLLTFSYVMSNYTADIGSFQIPGDETHLPILIQGSTEKYYEANSFSLQLDLYGIKRSTTMEINPVGNKFRIKYEKSFSKFNSTGEYEDVGGGNWLLKLEPFNLEKAEIQFREHLKIPFTKHTLSFYVKGNSILGKTITQDYFYNYAGGLIGMKGYPFYSIGGNEMAIINTTYRFPIIEKLDLQFAQIQFNKLYGSVYYDFGNAWNGENNFKNWKRDYGAELRMEMFSFYSYPTSLFINAAYGLDRISFTENNQNVNYDPSWRYYLGVLFGFEIE